MISLLAPKFAQIDATIATKNAQIAALQTELTELQEYRQQLLSVEQACESALSQVDTALMMLGHVDPSQIDTFKDALVVKFANGAIRLIEPAPPTLASADAGT
jgi:chromosome segregation ATPase